MRLKHFLRYPFDIRGASRCLDQAKALRRQQGRGGANELCSETTIHLDLRTDQLLIDCGRHLACMAGNAENAGLSVVLQCERSLLAAISHKRLGKMFLSMPNVFWRDSKGNPPIDGIVMSDETTGQSTQPSTIRMMIGRDAVAGTVVMPYPMHPKQISTLDPERLATLRGQPKAGVFFAGNQKTKYGRDGMRQQFGVLPRLEILSTLRDQFSDRIDHFDASGDPHRIVLRDSNTDPIAGKEWMPTLTRHRFFLCCPGASQPICHNLIESMAVGTVPVLEYADRLHPQLVDGVNAVCFQGKTGLVDAIHRIDAMSEAQRESLSRNAQAYFDQNLDGGRFLKRLISDADQGKVDRISMPFHDRNLFDPNELDKLRAA